MAVPKHIYTNVRGRASTTLPGLALTRFDSDQPEDLIYRITKKRNEGNVTKERKHF